MLLNYLFRVLIKLILQNEPVKKIFVGGIAAETTEEDVKIAMSAFGPVIDDYNYRVACPI